MYLVVLAGGSGTGQRASTGLERPTAAAGSDPEGRSPLQQTVACLEPLVDPMDVVVVTDRRFGQLVREQLPESRIVTEPMGRNTAAAVALATVAVERPDGEVMLVLPADLAIPADESLRDAV